ncbi:YheC/YheD family endospore coat-associated protein [Aneurinibacillus aneurinilyticus]|uniref:YheC/YheD family endospore coat-associated protein n=1 Tax=Aneurinibacillus aneurinilyticus TaxID=1391 RepID=UPI002E2085EF|nr:YheC/YheD family protein [Aneurinibacillus aneurinilyticus]
MIQHHMRIQRIADSSLPAAVDLLLPAAFAKKHGIFGTHTLEFVYGLQTAIVNFEIGATASTVRIRESLARRLHLLEENNMTYGFHFHPNTRKLIIGPLVGALIYRMAPTENGPFGGITDFCREMVQTCRRHGGLGFIFTLEQISPENDTVDGWTYHHNQWTKHKFPLPQCVYNRIGSRRIEEKKETQEKIAILKEKGSLFFNEQFLDKWHIHQRMSLLPETASFSPYTELYMGATSLSSMLQRYPYLYLKPSSGSLGRGIIRLVRSKQGYLCQYSSLTGTVTRRYPSFNMLHQMLRSRMKNQPYLMQQGLHLIKARGGIVDFRALVQKNKRGTWSITSIVGRSAPTSSSIVSNVAHGGTILSLGSALAAAGFPPITCKSIGASVRQHALLIAQLFEQCTEGHYAELGIDLGVDKKGKVWMLEINSKPSKTNNSVASVGKGPRPSVVRLIDYCFYRSGFISPAPKKAPQAKRRTRRK